MQSSLTSYPLIALMTDFGIEDGYVGVMKGVMAGIVPEARIIDITHAVAPQRVASGAWILAAAYRYFPARTVFVCVVDPGVGSARRAIAIHAGEWYFVGPDNGLFTYVMAEQPVHPAVLLSNTAYHLPQVSATFQGRDIFAPVGAHLARSAGQALPHLGEAIDPATLQRLDITPPVRRGEAIEARIVHVDRFGNLISNVPCAMVPDLFDLPQVKAVFPGTKQIIQQRRRFFADDSNDGGQPFIYGDSSGYLGIAIRNGSAAQALGVGYGANITFVMSTQ
jgi:S-adenosyl-L-methionine hydrolase (adenosine-forming)